MLRDDGGGRTKYCLHIALYNWLQWHDNDTFSWWTVCTAHHTGADLHWANSGTPHRSASARRERQNSARWRAQTVSLRHIWRTRCQGCRQRHRRPFHAPQNARSANKPTDTLSISQLTALHTSSNIQIGPALVYQPAHISTATQCHRHTGCSPPTNTVPMCIACPDYWSSLIIYILQYHSIQQHTTVCCCMEWYCRI